MKMTPLALVVGIFMMLVNTVIAGPQEILEKVTDKYPVKVGTYYELGQGEWDLISGVTIKDKIKGLPLDLALYTDGDKAVFLGTDINVKLTKNSRLGIGLIFGLDRVESFNDFGEFKCGPSVVAKIRF